MCFSNPPSPLYKPEDYSTLKLHNFQTIHASLREGLKVSREEMIRKQHLHASPVTFDYGDSVMLRSHAKSCKLEPKLRVLMVLQLNSMAIKLKS